MAHSNWVNSSSRQVYTKIKCRPYFDYSRSINTIEYKSGLSVNNECYIVNTNNVKTAFKIDLHSTNDVKQNASTRYLQISGNNKTNDYPVNLTIKDNTSDITYTITGNTKCDIILDLGSETGVPSGFEINITKWSRPKGILDIVYIGYNLVFEIQDMVKTYTFDDGIPYDGKSAFSYGVKSNTGTIDLLKDNINYGVCYSSGSKVLLLSRYEAILNNSYANVLISVKTDGEYDYTQICNMFVYNIDDDKNNISATLNISDVFYIMNMLTYSDLTKYPNNAKISDYAYTAIRSFEAVSGFKILSIEPDYVNFDSFVDNKINLNGEKFFTVLDMISKATNTFIIQNMNKDTVEFKFLKRENLTPVDIKYNDCYSIKDERHINNNITQVKATPCIIDSTITAITSETGLIHTTEYLNYLNQDFNSSGNNILTDKVSEVNPWIQMKNIQQNSSTFFIPKSDYQKYKSFGIVLKCATAYRKVYTRRQSTVSNTLTATVTGETSPDTVMNSRLKDTTAGQSRLYIKNTDMETISLLSSINTIDEKALTTLVPEFNIKSVEETSDNKIGMIIDYNYNFVRYFKSILVDNQYYMTDKDTIITGLHINTDYEQYYLGAYTAFLVGNTYDYTTVDVVAGEVSNNTNTIDTNLLIQQGNKVGGAITGQDQATVLCQDIYNEFKNGKKVATIEYIGSPHIKPYTVVRLENNTIYRIAKITTSSTGGFRQKLTLIEKE